MDSREATVLKMRFGMVDGRERTLPVVLDEVFVRSRRDGEQGIVVFARSDQVDDQRPLFVWRGPGR